MNTSQIPRSSVANLRAALTVEYHFIGNEDCFIENIRSIGEADETSLVWCSPTKPNKQTLVDETSACVIICDGSIEISEEQKASKAFFVVDNPKLAFSRLVRSLLSLNQPRGIHPSAVVHPEAEISKTAFIGPNCTIGACKIGDHSQLHGNIHVYDDTEIGNHVVIEAGAILGAEGFGMAKTDDGVWERFPHIGGLEIHDFVEIGAGTTIDRGTLENTVIGEGTKVSKSAHISHNVQIGKNCLITGCVSIAGSTTIGDNVWISPNATILNKLNIGNNVFISIGAIVTQDIKDDYQAIGRKILPKTK